MSDHFLQRSNMFSKPKNHSYPNLTQNISTRLEFHASTANASTAKQVPPRLPVRIQIANKKTSNSGSKGKDMSLPHLFEIVPRPKTDV